jgi:hypothetical protein
MGTSYKEIKSIYETKEVFYTENVVQEVEIVPDDATRDFLRASEEALKSTWMTAKEVEAWKDL